MGRMLQSLPSLTLTDAGLKRACQGRDLGAADFRSATPLAFAGPESLTRLMDAGGDLVALAGPSRTPGLLHPAVVLR
jgi:hypothetical protein